MMGYVARSCLKKEKDKGCDSVVEYLGSKCEALSSVPGATRVDTQVYLRLRDNKQDYMARAWTAWPEPGLHLPFEQTRILSHKQTLGHSVI